MRGTSPVRLLLWPVSLVWGAVVLLRAALYRWRVFRPKRLPKPVISVGNLTAGGTGKTPVVLWIADRLRAEGNRVGILTRGYRGRPAGVAGEPQSDEVSIFRERIKDFVHLGVGPDRYASGRILARHGIDYFVLDDGFQHLQLARDADIVLIDATDPFGGGHLLPAGLLREPKSALSRAGIIVITRSRHVPALEAIVRHYSRAPIFYAVTELLDVLPLPGQPSGQVDESSPVYWRKEKVFAFCAVGNADSFFNDLNRWGFHIAGRASFPDHHRYSQSEASKLIEQAKQSGAAALICTEKDVFNLRGITFSGMPAGFARIEMNFLDADAFWAAVIAKTK
ncbi:MAG TPA: tetraacyldisaccharide 4'-kinase [Candidatus Acidoferrales bacterium]|nr:tetraacyldisaccharide 4'-kinase [Candidatus Acidoferrales bacterium]